MSRRASSSATRPTPSDADWVAWAPCPPDRRSSRPRAGPHPAHRLQRDVGAGGADRCAQPRQGFPDVDGPAVGHRRRRGGAGARAPTSTPPASASPPLRAGDRAPPAAPLRPRARPRPEVVVTTGCTEAIAAALLGLVDPGDEVVVLEPYYDSYVAMLDMCGARTPPRHAARAATSGRTPTSCAPRSRRHQAHPAQHPAQPDRHRAHPRGAPGRRRPGDRARRRSW